MKKGTRLLVVIAIVATIGIIVMLAFSALTPVQATLTFIGSLVLMSIVLGSYISLSNAIDKYEASVSNRLE